MNNTTKMTIKKYNLFTDTRLPEYSIENHGDRVFILRGKYERGWTTSDGITINGDARWEINNDNLLRCASYLFSEAVEEIEKEKEEGNNMKNKKPSFIKRIFGLK